MAPGQSASGINLSKLGPKLQYQKDHRGAGPSTDKVFTALEQAGFKAVARKQILGDAAGANFCENAQVNEFVVVVCEYGSEKDATAAKTRVDKDWNQLTPTLERVVRGASIITIVHGGNKTADLAKIIAVATAA